MGTRLNTDAAAYDQALQARGGRVFAVGCMTMLTVAVAGQMLPSVLARISEEFSRNFAQRGALVGIFYVAFVTSTVLGGTLSDRLGQRLFILLGLSIMVAGLALVAMGQRYRVIQAGIFAIGLSGGFVESPVSAAVARAFPRRRAEVLNLTQIFFNLGAVAGPALAAGMLWAGYGWRAAFGAVILLVLSVEVFTAFSLPARPRSAPRTADKTAACRLPRGLICALSITLFFYVAAEMATSQLSANFVEEVHGMQPQHAPLVVAGFWLSMGLGRFIYARIVQYTGYLAPLLASAVLSMFSALGAAWAPSTPIAVAACCLLGLFLGGSWPTILGYAAHRIRHRTGAVFGIIVACGATGAAVGPMLAGWLAERSALGLKMAMLSGAGWAALMALMVLGIWLWDRRAFGARVA